MIKTINAYKHDYNFSDLNYNHIIIHTLSVNLLMIYYMCSISNTCFWSIVFIK